MPNSIGLILSISDKNFTVTSQDISNAATKGATFVLEKQNPPLSLGTANDMMNWLTSNGFTIPAASSLPSPLSDFIAALSNIQLQVASAAVKILGSEEKAADPNAPAVDWGAEFNAIFSKADGTADPKPLIGGLNVVGLAFIKKSTKPIVDPATNTPMYRSSRPPLLKSTAPSQLLKKAASAKKPIAKTAKKAPPPKK